MTLALITPPDERVATLAEAKAQLRITNAANDDLITALIAACVAQLDPAGGGWLGRALRPQTWELRLDGFPYVTCGSGYRRNFRTYSELVLPYPPLISVDSVKYVDGDGVEQTLALGAGYRVLGTGGRGSVAPPYGGSWPSGVRADSESVRVRFTCGYESGEDIDLPTPIKQAVILMVKELYQMTERNLTVSAETVDGVGSRQFIVSENASKVLRAATESLLMTYRVYE